jgi:microcystin-dependent protein
MMFTRKSNALNSDTYYKNQVNQYFTVRGGNHIPIVDILRTKENVWVMAPNGAPNAYNLNTGGSIGINTTTPQAALDVHGGASVTGQLAVKSNNIRLDPITLNGGNEKNKIISGDISRLNGTMQYSVLTPPASIVAYLGVLSGLGYDNTVPSGWLFCDGRAYSSTDYPNLYAIIGQAYGTGDSGSNDFNVPDLRGTFLRGAYASDAHPEYQGAALDSNGSLVPSFQLPSVGQHTHPYSDAYLTAQHSGAGGDTIAAFPTGGVTNNGTSRVDILRLDSTLSTTSTNNITNNNDPPISVDNRPFNIGVNWIIKF